LDFEAQLASLLFWHIYAMLTTKITLVENNSEEQVLSAVDFLKQSTFVYLDTRGVNVGYTDGRLSLICLGTFQLEVLHIFIFYNSPVTGLAPTVAPVDSSIDNEPPALPAFKSLFDLLSSEQMTKVMWDGRSDYVEVRDRYGVGVQSIIDLQIVELVSRFEIRTESPTEHFERVAKRFSHRNAGKHNVVTREIHILSPMQEYAQQHNIDIKFGNGTWPFYIDLKGARQ
jgi:exonuclease 3'-5' domain-containing protein 1